MDYKSLFMAANKAKRKYKRIFKPAKAFVQAVGEVARKE